MQSNLSKISVFMGKNKRSKVIYVKESTFYLKKLQQESKSEYVFPSQKNPKEPISDVTAYNYVKAMGRHVNKKLYPYLIRHTRSQELYEMVDKNKLSENVAMKTLGHKKSMRDIYHNVKDSTIKEAIENSVYKFEEMPIEEKNELKLEIEELRRENKKIKEEIKTSAEQTIKKMIEIMEETKRIQIKNKIALESLNNSR